MFKLVLEKAEEPEIKLPTSAGSWKKQESSRKTFIFVWRIIALLLLIHVFDDPADIYNLFSGSSLPCLNPVGTSGSSQFMYC